MTEDDKETMWTEIVKMRTELDSIKIKRGVLESHLTEMKGLASNLEVAHHKAEDMVHEIEDELTRGENEDAGNGNSD